jgi:Putative heavy-metal-binding
MASIEIYEGGIDRPYREIGPIKVKIGARTAFSKSKTIEEVNRKLADKALEMGANAVIHVEYDRGISMTSWKSLSAKGTAIYAESDEIKCPFCAEPIKRAAIKCKHCGEILQK